MKSPITSTVVIFLSSFLLLVSCTKESNRPQVQGPTILLDSPILDNPYLGQTGEVVSFSISALIPGKFNGFSIVERKNNADQVLFQTTRILDPSLTDLTAFSHEFEYELVQSGEEITLIFILTDQAGNDVTDEWDLKVN